MDWLVSVVVMFASIFLILTAISLVRSGLGWLKRRYLD